MAMATEAGGREAIPAAAVGFGLLAVAAGWVLPGLGHVLVGRAKRGLLFALIILGSFALGLVHQGRLALWDHKQPFLSSLQVLANAGVGPADLVARWAVYGGPVYEMEDGSSYGGVTDRSDIFRNRESSALSPYGTAYLWTAGLMNLMLLFEVWDIATGRKDAV
jgi:hypothetical protein